jgi:Domain of unknown function (DUF4376)
MFALIVAGADPLGSPVNLVRELFATNPKFHTGLDVRDIGDLAVTVGMIAFPDGSFGPYVEPAPTKSELKDYAGVVRKAKETGGITVAGAIISTDRESQAMINGAYNLAQVNPAVTFRFKAEGGFVVLDATAIATVAVAVGTHVQACFTKEADVDASIDGGTLTTRAGVDAAFA